MAKRAKKVDPLPEFVDGRKSTVTNTNNIYEFFDALDIKGGRYEVKLTELYNIYSSWDTAGTNYKQFRRKLSEAVKVKGQLCKLNRKLQTIQQTFKELNHGKKDEEE